MLKTDLNAILVFFEILTFI